MDGVTGDFNANSESKILIHIDEGGQVKPAHWNYLKSLVTSDSKQLKKKFVDSMSIDSFDNYLVTTNEDKPLPGDRRVFQTRVSCQKVMNKDYFDRLWEFEGKAETRDYLYTYLQSRDLSNFKPDDFPQEAGVGVIGDQPHDLFVIAILQGKVKLQIKGETTKFFDKTVLGEQILCSKGLKKSYQDFLTARELEDSRAWSHSKGDTTKFIFNGIKRAMEISTRDRIKFGSASNGGYPIVVAHDRFGEDIVQE
jgi:hypothetical protein